MLVYYYLLDAGLLLKDTVWYYRLYLYLSLLKQWLLASGEGMFCSYSCLLLKELLACSLS
jgi:hypothetical protein